MQAKALADMTITAQLASSTLAYLFDRSIDVELHSRNQNEAVEAGVMRHSSGYLPMKLERLSLLEWMNDETASPVR